MNKLVEYLTIITLIMGCMNRNNEKKDVVQQNMVVVNDKNVLRDDLVVKLKHFVKMISKDSDVDSIKGICYTVAFHKENLNTLLTVKDTAIIISYYAYGVDTVGYRGILLVDDYPVAVIDKDNIGLMFYDERALIEVPLIRFNQVKYRVGRVINPLKVEHGKLKSIFKEMDNEF